MDKKRSLNSFGVAGLLAEKCHILHSSVFSPRDIGRVSDLISARLRNTGADDLRLRALLLFSAFEAYRGQAATAQMGKDQPLEQPISLECGCDADQIAISFSFALHQAQIFSTQELEKRLSTNTPANNLEKILCSIYSYCDGVIVRTRMSQKQIEIVSVFQLNQPEASTKTFLAIDLDQALEVTPRAGEYTELGDLDYDLLLRENKVIPKTVRETPSGSIVPGGAARLAESLTRIAGQADSANNEMIKISGTTEKIPNSIMRVASRPADTKQLSLILKHAGQLSFQKIEHEEPSRYEARIRVLEAQIDQLRFENQMMARNPAPLEPRRGPARDPEPESTVGSVKKLFGKFFNSEPESSPVEKEKNPAPDAKEGTHPTSNEPLPETALAQTQPLDLSDEKEILEISEKLTEEIGTGELGKIIRDAQNDFKGIENELQNPKVRRWVERLVGSLEVEKQKLFERADKLNMQIRQKEAGFKVREKFLQDEINKQVELVKAKNYALNQARMQLSQATANTKSSRYGSAGLTDEMKLKQGLQSTQKMAQAAKEEANHYKVKLEELRRQLNALQTASKNRGPSSAEFSALQTKYERAMKQVEEFRRTNTNLTEKIAAEKKDFNSGTSALELRRKLDAAMKNISRSKSELQEVQNRLTETKREELRLKGEVERLSTLIRASRNKNPPKAA